MEIVQVGQIFAQKMNSKMYLSKDGDYQEIKSKVERDTRGVVNSNSFFTTGKF